MKIYIDIGMIFNSSADIERIKKSHYIKIGSADVPELQEDIQSLIDNNYDLIFTNDYFVIKELIKTKTKIVVRSDKRLWVGMVQHCIEDYEKSKKGELNTIDFCCQLIKI